MKPDAIRAYEALLKKAIFAYNKAESYAGKKTRIYNQSTTRYMHRKAESKFEKLLELLQEILAADPSLSIWFDRPIDFGPTTFNLSIDPIGMPRVITSRSFDNLRKGHIQTHKRELKQKALEDALAEIEADKERAKTGITKEQEQTAQKEQAQTQLKRLKRILGNL